MKKNSSHITIRRSCINDQAVWIHKGSPKASIVAYWRACKREVERVKRWSETLAQRRKNIYRLLSRDSDSSTVFDECLTDDQKIAVRKLLAISKMETDGRTAFYDHIIEERRRRHEDREIRRKMRERNQYNRNYDK